MSEEVGQVLSTTASTQRQQDCHHSEITSGPPTADRHQHHHHPTHGHGHSHYGQPCAVGGQDYDPELERAHFHKVLNAFRRYRPYSLAAVNKRVAYLDSLPSTHQDLLIDYRHHLQAVSNCIEANHQMICHIITDEVVHMFDNVDYSIPGGTQTIEEQEMRRAKYEAITRPTGVDIEKVYSVLKQIVREWSAEGAEERRACFDPILRTLCEHFAAVEARENVRILVPGAGLGRLMYEIARLGFSCQGNEYSFFMLIASNFILNRCRAANIFTCFPFAHQNINNITSADQVRPITFPDENPSMIPENVEFSMGAGNFTEIYADQPESWDAIVTCFFLDTAPNVVAYIETISKLLRPGGIWLNLGPLLYHYADSPSEDSIEPPLDIIRSIAVRMGFVFLREELNLPTTYTQNRKSMLSYQYRSAFFVCEKPRRTPEREREASH